MTATTYTAVTEVSAREAVSCDPDALLEASGAVVLREAYVDGADALADLAADLGLEAVDQLEPFAARQPLGRGVWSQPTWPSNSPMCMHHELGWQRQPPPFLLIACLQPAESGGATGVADGRAVLPLLPDRVAERARLHGWSLVRRYAGGLVGMPWQEAFAGFDEAELAAYAAAEEIELEWGPQALVTRRTRPAIRPTGGCGDGDGRDDGGDGGLAWSNLLAFCSEWTMDPMVRDYLVSALGREGLPFETSYGDGEPFTAADVADVNGAYEQATARIELRAGDVLLLDNIRTAHSKEPYTGERRTAVLHAGHGPRFQ